MAILKEDLKFYKSSTYNDTTSNGGLPSNVSVVNAVSENIFPTISQAERLAGSTKYRKLFAKPDADGEFSLYNSRVYIENPTLADEAVFLFPGTISDIQSSLTGSERVYGCGWLDSGVVASDDTLLVRIENASQQIFQAGDQIRISNKTDIDDTLHTEEVRTIDTVSYSSQVATITLTTPLDNSYSATDNATRVASLLNLNTIQCATTGFNIVSSGGTYDDTTYPVILNNRGCVKETWTITFTTSSGFRVEGATLGLVGTGSVTSGASPTNPATNKPYFTITSAGFGGSWSAGNTISFTTNPSVSAVWFKRVVPANTAAFTGNKFVVVFDGEAD